MEGQSSPGVPFGPVLAVVVAVVHSARLQQRGEDSTPPGPIILRRERGPRNYGYALTGLARVPELAPENYEADAQHGALFLKLLPHGLPDSARDAQ